MPEVNSILPVKKKKGTLNNFQIIDLFKKLSFVYLKMTGKLNFAVNLGDAIFM